MTDQKTIEEETAPGRYVAVCKEFATRAMAIHARIQEISQEVTVVQRDALSVATDVRTFGEQVAADSTVPSEKRDELVGMFKALEIAITALAAAKMTTGDSP